ncbi:hypothetical protein [Vogesella indigofera]|uniref:hypothetical protein n=1 Tax=Vogesella indigofera TaxID=45465 RepID=UPI00234F66BC|nr:hypothetical protein [Vogesella indigofera]MDC7707330.1 hypothetical protein [Vogesella indigofera]
MATANIPEMQTKTLVAPHFGYWFLALFAVTQIPLYWVQYPDITDFPNHMARLHVQTHLPGSEILQRYYLLRPFQLGTNLAMDVVVPALARWMSDLLALKLFASLAILLVTSGAVALGYAITGRIGYILLGALIFSHNAMFQLGLFNYMLGLGVAFWLLAAWICFRSRLGLMQRIAFAIGCVLVYSCHLSAFGIYAIGVLGYELGYLSTQGNLPKRPPWKSLFLSLTQFIPVAMLHLLVSISAGNYAPMSFSGSWLQTALTWLIHKLTILVLSPSICVSGYTLGQSVFGFLLVFVLYVGFREQVLKLASPVRRIAGLLTVTIVLLPHAGFGSNLVDIRLIPALGLLVCAGLEINERSKLEPKFVLAGIAIVVTLISMETTREWKVRDAEYQHVRTALSQIQEGSKLATVVLNENTESPSISPHVGAWSVIDRSAFLSNFYLWPFQPFLVSYQLPYIRLATLARTDSPGAPPTRYEVLEENYDYILVFGGNETKNMHHPQNIKLIFISRSMRLFRTDAAKPGKNIKNK